MRPGLTPGAVLLFMALGLACGGSESLPPPSQTGGGPTTSTTTGDSGTGESSTDAETGTDGDTESGSTDETGGEPETLDVLFVGNSYTFFNDLPLLTAGVASSLGDPILITDSRTAGGATFGIHLNDPSVTDAIATGEFEFVVLQGQSAEPIHPAMSAAAQTNALALAQLVTDISAEPVFFETWARGPGHIDYDEAWTGGSPSAMQDLLHAAYSGYAMDSGGTLSPVGQAWIQLLTDDAGIELYDADLAHPSIAGSYLAACVMYAAISGNSPVGATGWPDQISEEDALTLQNAADAAVFE